MIVSLVSAFLVAVGCCWADFRLLGGVGHSEILCHQCLVALWGPRKISGAPAADDSCSSTTGGGRWWLSVCHGGKHLIFPFVAMLTLDPFPSGWALFPLLALPVIRMCWVASRPPGLVSIGGGCRVAREH